MAKIKSDTINIICSKLTYDLSNQIYNKFDSRLKEGSYLIKNFSYYKRLQRFHKYPNMIKNLIVTHTEQLWVADITYICIGYDFNYLSIITDAYSKQIMGYCLYPYLINDGCIEALRMALTNRSLTCPLIHHSDRGVQYCSYDYVNILRENKVSISMTDSGERWKNSLKKYLENGKQTAYHQHLEANLSSQL